MRSSKASRTAKVIAASTILLESDERSSSDVAPGAAGLCRIFLSGSMADRLLALSARCPPTRACWRAAERLMLPGIMAHYWSRKRWIEARCHEAISEGFQRIVILGAGFDTLGIRLAGEWAGIEIIEADHPATQAAKRTTLADKRVELPENLSFIPLDLTHEDLPLFQARSTVFIAEGLLMYLPEARVSGLLKNLREKSNGRVRFIFSFMTRWPDGGCGFRPRSTLVERWLGWCGEPFLWAIGPEELGGFLEARGFKLVRLARTAELRDCPGTLDGENLVVCEPLRD